MAENYAPQYTKGQTASDGKKIVETVSDSTAEFSIETELSTIETGVAIPALHDTDTLLVRGSLKGTGTASSTQRNLLEWAQYGPIFDVTGYGAEGDGTTDDYTAILAALTAADAVHGGIVFFPPVDDASKFYLCGTGIDFTNLTNGGNNIHLMGAGFGPTDKVGIAFTSSADGFDLDDAANVTFSNLNIGARSTFTGTNLISAPGHDLLVENCGFYSNAAAAQRALHLYNANVADLRAKIRHCTFGGSWGSSQYIIHCEDTLGVVLEDLIMTLSDAELYGGIYLASAASSVTNNLARLKDIQITQTNGHINGAPIMVGDGTNNHSGTIWMDTIYINSTVAGMWAIEMKKTERAILSNIYTTTNSETGGGIYHSPTAAGSDFLQLSNSYISNTHVNATTVGLQCDGTGNVMISSTYIGDWLGAGPNGDDISDGAVANTDIVAVGSNIQEDSITGAGSNFDYDPANNL